MLALLAAACSGDAASGDPTSSSPSGSATAPSQTQAGGESEGSATNLTTAPPVDTVPQSGGAVTVLLAADPTPTTGWTPWDDVCAWACRNVIDHVLETLAVVLPEGTVEPWLAESITPDVSLTRWTVRLRQGITFSDGEQLNAITVKGGIDRYLKTGRASRGHMSDARLVTVQAPDEATLVFELSEANAGFPATLAGPVGRVFSLVAADADPDGFAIAPVGTGPFTFASWAPNQPVLLEANPNYWRRSTGGEQLPYLTELNFVQVPDEIERFERLVSGQGDVLQTRAPQTITRAREAVVSGAALTVVGQLDDNTGAIVFNTLRAPFNDVRVRRGLALAVDQALLLDTLDTDVQAATQWWAPTSVWHSNTVDDLWPSQDLAAAVELLRDYAGDPDRSDKRERGEPIQVRLQCTDDPALRALIVELKRQLEATGLVTVESEIVSRTGLIQRVTGSVADRPSFSGDFTATCWRLGGESDPWVLLNAATGPVRTSPLNVSNLHTEDLDRLVNLVRSNVALALRRDAIKEIMQLFVYEVPYLYLGYASSAVIAAESVRGLQEWSLPSGGTVQGQRLGVGHYTEIWVPSG